MAMVTVLMNSTSPRKRMFSLFFSAAAVDSSSSQSNNQTSTSKTAFMHTRQLSCIRLLILQGMPFPFLHIVIW